MATDWTRHQYVLFRALLGSYVAVHFALLLPWAVELFSNQGMIPVADTSALFGWIPSPLQVSDHPTMVITMTALGAVCGILLAVGRLDRAAALCAALILGWLFQRNPLIANPSLPLVGWMLIAHALVKSLKFRDEVFQWRLDPGVWAAAWVVLAVAYSYSGYTKLLSPSWLSGDAIRFVLENPLARDHIFRDWLLTTPPIVLKLLTWTVLYVELLFAPLALFTRLRPWLWSVMLSIQFGFLVFLNFADLTLPMLLIHLLTFNPGWLAENRTIPRTVFYDGNCALCHRVVLWSLAEDAKNQVNYASLQGDTAADSLPKHFCTQPLESFVVKRQDGKTLIKSAAVLDLMTAWGGLWRIGAAAISWMPRRWLNAGYDFVGSHRIGWFGTTDSHCPLVPARLRKRFLA